MIFSENRFTLFRIMLEATRLLVHLHLLAAWPAALLRPNVAACAKTH
jgi:hypothetical protein